MSAFTLCLGTPWQYMNFMVVTSNLKFMDCQGVPYRIGHRGGRGVEGKGGLRLGLGSWGAHRPSTRTYPHTSTLPHLPAYLLVPADDGVQLPLTGCLDGGEGTGGQDWGHWLGSRQVSCASHGSGTHALSRSALR